MTLKHEYTDLRGCIIPCNRVEYGLAAVGKTEDELRTFIGERWADMPGYFYYFLQGYEAHHSFQESRA